MAGLHLAPQPLFLHFRILFPDLCAQGHGRHSSQFVEICIGCTCTSPSFFLLVIGTLALKNISFNLFPRQQFKKRWSQQIRVKLSSIILRLQLQARIRRGSTPRIDRNAKTLLVAAPRGFLLYFVQLYIILDECHLSHFCFDSLYKSFFIGPRSDHSLPMSVTHGLVEN